MDTNMDSKRLANYPKTVRKLKRLRKQIVDLNRCIRKLKSDNDWMERHNDILHDCLKEDNRSTSDTLFNILILGMFIGASLMLLVSK